MYEAYYRLNEKPFNLTPDPKFLYLSDKHKEAFAHLLFGIKNRSGFVMVTGEIGTGKTTICRNLLNQLDDDTNIAFIFNPALNPVELMRKINHEFGIDNDYDNTLDLSEVLNAYLLAATAAGKNCVLVIDEAQNLAPPVLEQIRLLSNLETEKEKLLQIILIGQPELSEKLELYELRQLNQRITARYHLNALNALETRQYIAYRINVAGGRKYLNFTKAACQLVYKKSKGTPRVINAICDRALLIGYTMEVPTITPAIVKRAAKEVKGGRVTKRQAVQRTQSAPLIPRPLIYALVIVPIILALLYWYRPDPELKRQHEALLAESERQIQLLKEKGQETDEDTPAKDSLPAMVAPVVDSLTMEKVDAAVESNEEPAPAKDAAEEFTEPTTTDEPPEVDSGNADKWQTALFASEAVANRNLATKTLLHRWGKAVEADLPQEDNLEQWQRFAKAHGLAADVLEPALDQLLAIGLPVMLRLREGEETRWCTLQGIEEDQLTVNTTDDAPVTLSRYELATLFDDAAVLFWLDPSPGAPDLLPGRQSATVSTLKKQLRALKRLKANNTSNVYDAEVASAVAKIQAETGLLIDGMAGRQVRMVLSSWLGEESIPALAPRTVVALAPVEAPTSTPVAEQPQEEEAPSTPAAEETVTEVEKPEEAPAPTEEVSEADQTEEQPEEATEEAATIPEEAPVAPRGEEAATESAPTSEEQVEVKELDKPAAPSASSRSEEEGLRATTAPAPSGVPLVPSTGQE